MELGSIVWARLDKFAYWPAMIYRNPINENGIVSHATKALCHH